MSNTAPGWYADPHDASQLRYWDGTAWTDHRHPVEAQTEAVEGTPAEGWYPDPEDAAQQRYWDGARWTDDRAPAAQALTPQEQRAIAQAEKRASKQRAKEQKTQERADRETAELELAGEMLAYETFGLKSIKIYAKGYVRIGLLATSKAPLERLISIEASSDVQKKTGLGRAVAAVPTAGYNLLASNKRGDVYLTIVTDRKTYVLHEDPPTAGNMRAVKALEAAGLAVIRADTTYSSSDTTFASAPTTVGAGDASVSDRLRELQSLHAEGLVSDEEYAELRARLLGSL